jgi:hypothetical protein
MFSLEVCLAKFETARLMTKIRGAAPMNSKQEKNYRCEKLSHSFANIRDGRIEHKRFGKAAINGLRSINFHMGKLEYSRKQLRMGRLGAKKPPEWFLAVF